MSKEKFLKSVLKLSDLDHTREKDPIDRILDIAHVRCRIVYDIYEPYARRTHKPRYKYINILIGYLLLVAYKIKQKTKQTPSLSQVCQNSYDVFVEKTKKTNEYPCGFSIPTILRGLCDKYLDQTIWEQLVGFIDEYDEKLFAEEVIDTDEEYSKEYSFTPYRVRMLALKILNIQNGDKVMDLGCGTAGFMTDMFRNDKLARYTEGEYADCFPGGKYYGYEISTEECEIAVLRANLLGVHYIGRDFFNVDDEYKKGICDTRVFDKIFADYPRGLKYLPHHFDNKNTSSDWMFNGWICSHLHKKAVAIMSNGAAWNMADRHSRKEFVEKGLIEAVIALPAGLFPNTATAATMIVFSHGNNSIKMVDATKVGSKFPLLDIEKILKGLASDTDYSKTVSITELQDNDYVLNYNRYINSYIKFENGKQLGDLILSFRRGGTNNTKDFSSQKTTNTTDVQYLSLSNIKNGLIDEDLPYVSIDADEVKKSDLFLKENDLIISKSGQPYKIAVADPRRGQLIIPCGNMYIIELDTTKVNPYYVKAFLESQRGIALLNSRSNQATIINISREELQKIEIPVPSMAVQRRIAKAYLARADEYKVYQSKLEDVSNRLSSVFDDNYKD